MRNALSRHLCTKIEDNKKKHKQQKESPCSPPFSAILKATSVKFSDSSVNALVIKIAKIGEKTYIK